MLRYQHVWVQSVINELTDAPVYSRQVTQHVMRQYQLHQQQNTNEVCIQHHITTLQYPLFSTYPVYIRYGLCNKPFYAQVNLCTAQVLNPRLN